MNFVKQRKSLLKVAIAEKDRKEIEFIFFHDIVSEVGKYITLVLIADMNQTPIKYLSVCNETLVTWGEHSVAVKGSIYKRSMTGKNQQQLLKVSTDQNFLIIMDVFTGQMTTDIYDAFKEANIHFVIVPVNLTNITSHLI